MQYFSLGFVLENILVIVGFIEVSKLDRFKDNKELQLENILFISFTNEVLKLLIFKYFKFLHPLNICSI